MHPDDDPFASKRPQAGKPVLMDLSKARPPVDLDLSKFVRKSAEAEKSVYDTSNYMKQLREEDPWPDQLPKVQVKLTLTNCRFLDAAPLDLAVPVNVACDVAMLGLPSPDESVDLQLWTNYRESKGDTEARCGSSVTAKLQPSPFQTVTFAVPAPGPLNMSNYEPGTEIYLRAEAIEHNQNLSAKSAPIATIPGPTEIHRIRLSGMLFDLGKCFLLPEALPAVRMVVDYHKKHPRDQILIVGHAGKKSDPGVATARAKAFSALLTNKWEDWLPWFAPEKAKGQRWGYREAQLILGYLKLYKGQAPGMIDEATTNAFKGFQKSVTDKGQVKLEQTGNLDSPTRKELLRAYFGQEKTTLAKSMTPVVCGCQGHFDDVGLKGGATVDDDRLEILFFSPRFAPKPKGDTLDEKDTTYPKWLKLIKDTDDFEVHGLHIQVVNEYDEVVPHAHIKIDGPQTAEGDTDEHGWITFNGLKRGKYKLHVFEGEDRVSDPTIEVPALEYESGPVHKVKAPEPGDKE